MTDFDQLLSALAKGLAPIPEQQAKTPTTMKAERRNEKSDLHPIVQLLSANYTIDLALRPREGETVQGKLHGIIETDLRFIKEVVKLLEKRSRSERGWKDVWSLPDQHIDKHREDLQECVRIGSKIADILITVLMRYRHAGGDLDSVYLMSQVAGKFGHDPEKKEGEAPSAEWVESRYILLPYLCAATVYIIHATLALNAPDSVQKAVRLLGERFKLLLVYPKAEGTETLLNLNIIHADLRGKPPVVARHLRCGYNFGESLEELGEPFVQLAGKLRATTAHMDGLSVSGAPKGFVDERQSNLAAEIVLRFSGSQSS
jgi:hypothetical protein